MSRLLADERLEEIREYDQELGYSDIVAAANDVHALLGHIEASEKERMGEMAEQYRLGWEAGAASTWNAENARLREALEKDVLLERAARDLAEGMHFKAEDENARLRERMRETAEQYLDGPLELLQEGLRLATTLDEARAESTRLLNANENLQSLNALERKESERLRESHTAQLEYLKGIIDGGMADNARLREALEQVHRLSYSRADIQAIAREALEGK